MIAMYTWSVVLRDQNGLVFTIWKRTNNVAVINIMIYTFIYLGACLCRHYRQWQKYVVAFQFVFFLCTC